MIRRAAIGLAVLVAVVACGPMPTPTGASSATPTPESTASPTTRLVITGSGEIRCMMPYGCEAILSIVPVDGAATIEPDWFDRPGIRFERIETGSAGDRVVGPAIDPPMTLDPGRYLVIAAVTIVSDVASEGPDGSGSVFPALGASSCEAPLTVDDATTEVRIVAHFDVRQTCDLAIERDP